jgi:glutamate-ammonia-ligase adenylyltransferase
MTQSIETCLGSIPEPLHPSLVDAWEAFQLIDAVPESLISDLLQVWSCSEFVQRNMTIRPELGERLLAAGYIQEKHTKEQMLQRVQAEFAEAQNLEDLMRRLKHQRVLESMRITWRDLTGVAELDEVLRATSDLAEILINETLEWCYAQLTHQFGVPRNAEGDAQQMVVIGMGKLGGQELNFSSDIDLIFAYPESGQTDGDRCLDNQQFFIRLGQQLIKILNDVNADGFVYRVDMRLRPFGDSGPLAVSFDSLENYYLTHGREWERYALIKARVVAGDQQAGAELFDMLRPFVYRRYLDYGAFEELRDMKAMIDRQARSKGQLENVKLGPGGIREVEFIGQAFQLVRGGRDPELQVRGIREVLRLIADKNLIPQAAEERLQKAYSFLRRTENHIQMWADQQAHDLPDSDEQRLRLAYSMGFEQWDAFKKELDRHRAAVARHFAEVFSVETDEQGEATGEEQFEHLWNGDLSGEAAEALFAEHGYEVPGESVKQVHDLLNSRVVRVLSDKGRKRLDRLMPTLLAEVSQSDARDVLLNRFLVLIQAIAGRSVYLALISEHPQVLAQLIRLFTASGWITEQVTRHPILLDELVDPRALQHLPNRKELEQELAREIATIDLEDIEQVMNRLRHFKHAQVFRVAAADVYDLLPVMKVSDHLTWIAEVILNQAVERVWAVMTQKHGRPRCVIDGEEYSPQLGVIAYGKMGGFELGYGSDLDIVFIHDSAGEKQATDGERSLDNQVFFSRVVQRLITMLTALTSSGELYEVDMRLRPSGNSGLLVASLQAFEKYQQEEAWTWEHQSLIRARPVVGNASIGDAFAAIRNRILHQVRDIEQLRIEVREMREKMWQEKAGKEAGKFDLKKDSGGITDIEFMVQYSVLANAHNFHGLTRFTDNIRILNVLIEAEVMTYEQGSFLVETYREFRDKLHELSLQEAGSAVDLEMFSAEREGVQQLWREVMQGEPFATE